LLPAGGGPVNEITDDEVTTLLLDFYDETHFTADVQSLRRSITRAHRIKVGKKQLNRVLYGESLLFQMTQYSANDRPAWSRVVCTCLDPEDVPEPFTWHEKPEHHALRARLFYDRVKNAARASPPPDNRAEGEPERVPPPSMAALNPFSGRTKTMLIVLCLLLLGGGAVALDVDTMTDSEMLHFLVSQSTAQGDRIASLERELAFERDKDKDPPSGGHCQALDRAYADVDKCIDAHDCDQDHFNAINDLRKKCKKRAKPRNCAGWAHLDVHLKSCLNDNGDCTDLMNSWLEFADKCTNEQRYQSAQPDCADESALFASCSAKYPVQFNGSEQANNEALEKCAVHMRALKRCVDPDSAKSRSAIALEDCESMVDLIDRFECQEDALKVAEGTFIDRRKEDLNRIQDGAKSAYTQAKDIMSDGFERGRDLVVRTTEHVQQKFKPRVGRNGDSGSSRRYYS
jgi:hypothetical protein